ncbi:type II toxin-antitoxin system RelE/ParE family toxin [Dyadobacter sp. CY343]|uniref:type II toxin-antitoxin system RelE/ParE family toxin n=1 Tax=Dyadobacter sp. CY343 TaxID=2907299 RepID=UPI001F3F8BD6|nr:type II toxin-antitoxin system RelE/ParE family toxin [Dyadobacter sp. CY343]MCE7058853.1 type II toxin-antitoxin system RelE/ParE family toxin [Dyadobacter sp. CY343]
MVDEAYTVVWDKIAVSQLREIYLYIRNSSYQNATSVRDQIIENVSKLKANPRRYNADKLRIDCNPDFRAFETQKIRISYYINESTKTVNIIRVRSVRQKPFDH